MLLNLSSLFVLFHSYAAGLNGLEAYSLFDRNKSTMHSPELPLPVALLTRFPGAISVLDLRLERGLLLPSTNDL